MADWMRLVPAVALLIFAVCLAAVQPWVNHEQYSTTGNITELSGWSTLNPGGRLWVHLSMRDAISNPRIMNVHLGGKPCANITGNLVSMGETDIYAQCPEGSEGQHYNGTITMTYMKSDTQFRFDYNVVGLFEGWRQ